MTEGTLGRLYRDGEDIVRQGDNGECMYVIQSGRVKVIREEGGKQLALAIMENGDFFGEMAIFDRQRRSATVRADGEARVLTIDKRTLFRRIQADPSLAFRIIETLSRRVRELDAQLTRDSGSLREP